MAELQKYKWNVTHQCFRLEDGSKFQPASGESFNTCTDVDARLALMQRAIDWCLDSAAYRDTQGQIWADVNGDDRLNPIPPEFAELIKPKAGETK